MSELRKDPIVGRWVIINPERTEIEEDCFKSNEVFQTDPSTCPFCQGHEHMTASEILAYRAPDTFANKPGWWIRVVPHHSAVLHIEGHLKRQGVGMFDMINGIGAHEVIVETPEHDKTFIDLTDNQVEKIFWAYRDRIIDLHKDDRFRHILIFKNHGPHSGAELSHSHSQLIASPIIPKVIKEELDGAKAHYNYKERCIYCDIIRQEISMTDRIIEENGHFAAFTPFAARYPYEISIMPKEHNCNFSSITKEQVMDLSKIMKSVLWRLNKRLKGPSYSYILHTCPNQIPNEALWDTLEFDYHWHIEIIPRLLKQIDLEWGPGFYVNPTPPEKAAAFLKEIN